MNAKIYTTNFSKNEIWKEETLEGKPADCMHQISVFPHEMNCKFKGFGGAFTEAAAVNYQKLPVERQKAFMEAYFGEDGLRYNIGRTHIQSCDFALGNYSGLSSAEDDIEKDFITERDDKYLIPMIMDAEEVAGKPISLLLSPWSPPAFMKSNSEMNHGGKLLPEYREAWADLMAKYVAYYREKGLTIKNITVQNEPAATQTWDSCIYSGEEEAEFAVNYLKAALEKRGCGDVAIYVWDHNKEILPLRADASMSVEGASDAIDGIGIHWYTGDHFDAIRYVREAYPNLDLFFTEGCVEYSRFDGMTTQDKAEMYAHDMLHNFKEGVTGYLDWNLLLDAKGGPNHVGNFCEAPIMLLEDESDFEIRTEYYYLGHFSRYIQAGAVQVYSSSYTTKLETVVFKNPDGTHVAVVLNRTEEDIPVCLSCDMEEGVHFTVDAHSIATICF